MLVRTALGNNWFYQLLYFDIAYYLFSFIVPLLLLAVFNSRLILTYRGVGIYDISYQIGLLFRPRDFSSLYYLFFALRLSAGCFVERSFVAMAFCRLTFLGPPCVYVSFSTFIACLCMSILLTFARKYS